MIFKCAAVTDIGISRKTNQDSVAIYVADTPAGQIALAVMCDGMGGLAKGEVASGSVINAFGNWFKNDFPKLLINGFSDNDIKNQWDELVNVLNYKIMNYGTSFGVNMGTTISAILITQSRYYVMNVGDSRVYLLSDSLFQITEDQTVVSREVKFGRLTEEQAKTDPRRSVLLQCIGASQSVSPDFFFGESFENISFLLCSDGFRHEITSEEIYAQLNPISAVDEQSMQKGISNLIELNKSRLEKDNITAALIRT